MGTVGTSVFFAINTTGANKAKVQWGLVAAAVVAVAAALNKARQSAQEFSNIWNSLTPRLKAFAIVADNAGRGLIDTTASMRQMAVQEKAGVKVTKEFAEAMAKLAVVEGQKLGKTTKEITAEFEKLSEGIAKGSTRALKQYGIDLENTEDLTLAQEEAMEKVIERSKGLKVEIQDLDQALFAYDNQIDTFVGNIWNWVSSSEALTGVMTELSDGLGILNSWIMETDGAMLDNLMTMDLVGEAMLALASGPVAFLTGGWDDLYQKMLITIAATKETSSIMGEGDLAPFTGPLLEDAGPAKKKKKGGGGGSSVSRGDTMTFTSEEVRQFEAEDITGAGIPPQSFDTEEDIALAIELNELLSDRVDIVALVAEEVAASRQGREQVWQQELDAVITEKQLQQEKHEWLLANSEEYREIQELSEQEALQRKWQLQIEAAQQEAEIDKTKHEWMLENSEKYRLQQAKLDKLERLNRVAAVAQMFSSLSVLQVGIAVYLK